MARQDQMEALYEFFGGGTGTYETSPSSVFSNIQTVIKGEPMTMELNTMPLIYIVAPKSREYRDYAQKKIIAYDLEAVVVQLAEGKTSGAQAPQILYDFYGFLDEVANKIRTNKILSTMSYPQGAAMRFGEQFTIEEHRERVQQGLFIVAKFTISSEELVAA